MFIKGKQQRSLVATVASVTTGPTVSTRPVSDSHSGEAAEKDAGRTDYGWDTAGQQSCVCVLKCVSHFDEASLGTHTHTQILVL